MPRLNGIDMVQQMRQVKPDIPVILISGDPESEREEVLTKLKPHQPPLIKKPFTLSTLMQTIQQQLPAD
jgi:CheY-like chemotaxis protein